MNRDGAVYSKMQAARLLPHWRTRRKAHFADTRSLWCHKDHWLGAGYTVSWQRHPVIARVGWLTATQQAQVAEFVPKTLADECVAL